MIHYLTVKSNIKNFFSGLRVCHFDGCIYKLIILLFYIPVCVRVCLGWEILYSTPYVVL